MGSLEFRSFEPSHLTLLLLLLSLRGLCMTSHTARSFTGVAVLVAVFLASMAGYASAQDAPVVKGGDVPPPVIVRNQGGAPCPLAVGVNACSFIDLQKRKMRTLVIAGRDAFGPIWRPCSRQVCGRFTYRESNGEGLIDFKASKRSRIVGGYVQTRTYSGGIERIETDDVLDELDWWLAGWSSAVTPNELFDIQISLQVRALKATRLKPPKPDRHTQPVVTID